MTYGEEGNDPWMQRRNVCVPWLMPVKMTLVYAQPDESLAADVYKTRLLFDSWM